MFILVHQRILVFKLQFQQTYVPLGLIQLNKKTSYATYDLSIDFLSYKCLIRHFLQEISAIISYSNDEQEEIAKLTLIFNANHEYTLKLIHITSIYYMTDTIIQYSGKQSEKPQKQKMQWGMGRIFRGMEDKPLHRTPFQTLYRLSSQK